MINFVDIKLTEEVTKRLEVTWEKDEDADPEARYICSCIEMVVVVTGPTIRLTENRLEMKIREQIAIMKAHGRFQSWLADKIKESNRAEKKAEHLRVVRDEGGN